MKVVQFLLIGLTILAFIVIVALTSLMPENNTASPVIIQRNTPTVSLGIGKLTCADCVAAGMPANIWADQNMSRLECRTDWGKPATILKKAGDIYQVRVPGACTGWIAASLVQQ